MGSGDTLIGGWRRGEKEYFDRRVEIAVGGRIEDIVQNEL